MTDVETAEAPRTSLRKIKANNGDEELAKLFTPARSIVSLGEGLVHWAKLAKQDTTNLNDGQEHTEGFGYASDSKIGRSLAALGSTEETHPTQNAYLDITYKKLPSQSGDKPGTEIHIQGQNDVSLTLTHQKAEDVKDDTIQVESFNGVIDVSDEKLSHSLASINQIMTMMLKDQRTRESADQQSSESVIQQVQTKPSRIKQLFKWFGGPNK